MSFQFDWYLQGRILLIKSPATYSEDDIEQLDQQLLQVLEHAEAPLVHVIYDESEAVSTPNVNAWNHMQAPKHPKYGWVIDVGMNAQVGFVYTLIGKIFRIRHRKFDTINEAVKFLQTVDATLPDFSLRS